MKDITNDTIKEFLIKCSENENDVNNFGHLIIPDAKELNDEALFYIKIEFGKFLNEE